ncbi:MAG TPA: SDR family oxidoreductase [Gemmatimonadales bacterium]|nr:SDR family oxidoreductase [Gemmatimonadales bacterium]
MRPLALVTGATAGIGNVFADRLAAREHDLLLVSRDAARLAKVARELADRHGIHAEPFPADLSRDDEIDRLDARIRSGPPLAYLINNAGFGIEGKLADSDPAPQAAMLHLHTLAPMRLIQAALPGMLARRAGAIVNVSSVASFIYAPGNANYSATKAYLTVFSEGLAGEVGEAGVQVQALCPGFTRTEFHDRMGLDAARLHRRPMWRSAEYVVDCSLRALDRRGPVVCIPDWRYRLLVQLIRFAPRRLIGVVTRRGRR